jgi:nicotinate-nucleotide adenylyltransferase
MALGILGGTFDPIHLAHLMMAQAAQETLALDRVLFVPAGDPPHKQGAISPAYHRRAMVELALAGSPEFELCPVDLDRPGPHYSTATVELIRRQHNLSADDCFFIIGGDSLLDLPEWHNPAALVSLCRLAVMHRPGYQPDTTALERRLPGLTGRLNWVPLPQIDLAASEIRNRVRRGQSIRFWVPEPVRHYIARYRLYQV